MVSSLQEGFSTTVAPFWAKEVLGGAGLHKSSQISTPTTRSGTFSQQNSRPLPKGARCPA